MFDTGADISAELNLTTQAQLVLSVTGKDSDMKPFTRSGTLTRCP
jgi:hypothetical protein